MIWVTLYYEFDCANEIKTAGQIESGCNRVVSQKPQTMPTHVIVPDAKG